jgi:hypothetical protein
MRALLAEPVFKAGGMTYSWADVVTAAELRGEWSQVTLKAREGREALARAEKGEGSRRILPAAVEERGNAFRYERGLEAAEDMEAWLDRWGLTVAVWEDWLRIDLLRSHGLASSPAREGDLDHEEFEEALLVEAVCSGDLERLANRLAERAAIEEARRGRPEPPAALEAHAAGLPPGPEGQDGERYARLAEQQARFLCAVDETCSPSAIDSHIAARRLDWMRVSFRALSFSDADQGREAALSIVEDGQTLEDVAASARSVLEEGTVFVDELEEAVRVRVMGARPGDLIGPISLEGRVRLYVVLKRVPPSTSDPEVVRRAASSLLEKYVKPEVASRIRWVWPF